MTWTICPDRQRPPARVLGHIAMVLAVCLAGCTLLPTPTSLESNEPGPTQLEPAGSRSLDVAGENHADTAFFLTIAQRTDLKAIAEVEPCSASNVMIDLDPPFSVGLGEAEGRGEVTRPEPTLVNSAELDSTDDYRVLVLISPRGAITIEPLVGVAEPQAFGDC